MVLLKWDGDFWDSRLSIFNEMAAYKIEHAACVASPRSHQATSPTLTRMLDKIVASISFFQEEYFWVITELVDLPRTNALVKNSFDYLFWMAMFALFVCLLHLLLFLGK